MTISTHTEPRFETMPTCGDNMYGLYRKTIQMTPKGAGIFIGLYIIGNAITLGYIAQYALDPSFQERIDTLTRPSFVFARDVWPVLTIAMLVCSVWSWRRLNSESYWVSIVGSESSLSTRNQTAQLTYLRSHYYGTGITFARIKAFDTWMEVYRTSRSRKPRTIRYDTIVALWVSKKVVIIRSCVGDDFDDVTDTLIDRTSFTKGSAEDLVRLLQPFLRSKRTGYGAAKDGIRQTNEWANPNNVFKQRHVKQYGLHTVNLGERAVSSSTVES